MVGNTLGKKHSLYFSVVAYPGRLTVLEHEFGLGYTTLSRLFITVLNWLDENHSFRVTNFLLFWRPYQRQLNMAVRRKGLPDGYETVNSFIDGTMRPCSVP